MDKPHAVVIGYGFAGRSFHSYLVGLADGLHLRGVCSRQAETRERIVAERGCQAYGDFADVLADPAVDLVVLATPNATHCELACEALAAGKHVVTDKVACLTVAQCDRMIAAAQAAGRFLTVFQNRRWDGDFLTLRQLLADGRLGDLRVLEMAWGRFGAWGGWRGQAKFGGGKLYDLGAHLVDQACLLCPEAIASVYAKLHHDWPQVDVESHAHVVINFAGGRTAIIDTSDLTALPKPRFYAMGTHASFRKYGLDPQEEAMKAGQIDEAVEAEANYGILADKQTQTTIPTLPGRWRNFYENVADVLTKDAPPAVAMTEVRRAISVLEGAFRSAATGNVVHVDQ